MSIVRDMAIRGMKRQAFYVAINLVIHISTYNWGIEFDDVPNFIGKY